jgi:hypothetical protein
MHGVVYWYKQLYDASGLEPNQINKFIDYGENDIEATTIFKKDNFLRMYLSKKSSKRAVESLGISFFALLMLEFYSQPNILIYSLSRLSNK